MPLPGGPADKVGGRYERSWTLLQVLRVLEGRADSIWIERSGAQGEGMEFQLSIADGFEWHQVKRQCSSDSWTVAALGNGGVLRRFGPKLQAGERCVFVSQVAAERLRELADRSRGLSINEFLADGLAGGRRQDFDRCKREWDQTEDGATYWLLRLVFVETISEPLLDNFVIAQLQVLVRGDPADARRALAELIENSLHGELSAPAIWHHLEQAGYPPRDLAGDPALRAVLNDAAFQFVDRLQRRLPTGAAIVRQEVRQVIDVLKSDNRCVVVTGGAGVGKSVVLSRVIADVRARGWSVLPLRADRLEHRDSPEALGRAMDLPASPVNVLAGVSRGEPALLVIDQLDAVSEASGRRVDRFDVLEDLIHAAVLHPSLRVLIACRRFDLENDFRLRRLVARDDVSTIEVGVLSQDDVQATLAVVGATSEPLDARLLELLQVPLHLSLYLELVAGGSRELAKSRTLQDLYDRYWETKRRACVVRHGDDDQWMTVVDHLVKEMNARQLLYVSRIVRDGYRAQVDAMVSEGVLEADDQRIGFFHETFFDYCFARRFINKRRSLEGLLSPAESQGLFLRSQVRQLLAFEGATDPDRYRRDLRWLLEPGHARPHLRDVVLAVVGQYADPHADEWEILAPIADQPPTAGDDALWRAIRSNPAWFPLIDATDAWEQWLHSSDERVVNRAVWALSGLLSTFPGRIVKLVAPFASATNAWGHRLLRLLLTANLEGGRPVIELLLQLIPTGVADQAQELTYALGQLAAREPALAVEVMEVFLARDLEHQRNACDAKPFALAAEPLNGHNGGLDLMKDAARGAPGEFIRRLLPIVLAVMELHERPEQHDDSIADAVWSHGVFGAHHDLSDHLYNGMALALETLADSDPYAAAPHLATLRSSRRTSALWLLARAYRAGAPTFADEAVDWLCSDPAALCLGYLGSPHWASRQLIEAISATCSQPALERLCANLLGYTPAWEKLPDTRRFRGSAELCLLNGINPTRRSSQVERRLRELRSKLGRDDAAPPQGVESGYIGSPIKPEKAERMTDEQWLRAIARYDADDFTWDEDGATPKGGAHELAQVLEVRAKEDPERFARFVPRFPRTAAPAYISAVLRGIGTQPLDEQLLIDVCRAAHERRDTDIGRWLVQLIEQRAATPLPGELLDIVAYYVTADSDPKWDDWQPSEEPETTDYGGDIDAVGADYIRGKAALALHALIQHDPARLEVLLPSLKHALSDPILAVRACAIGGLLGVLAADRDLAVELFVKTIARGPDELLASKHVERFVYWAARTHLDDLQPILGRMAYSHNPSVVTSGARQLAVASLDQAELDIIIDELLAGNHEQRQGVVTAFAQNAAYEPRRARIVDVLSLAFNDPDPKVRSEAQSCFLKLGNATLLPFRDLFQAYAHSRAMGDKFTTVFYTLETTCSQLPDTALLLCERWLSAHGDDAGNIATHAAAEALQVSTILLRLYTQHEDPHLRRRCLDLIDAMITTGACGIRQQLTSIDR